MDALTVLVIAVVVFAVFVLLTAYALKTAVIMSKESPSRAKSVKKGSQSAQENSDEGDSVFSK